MFFSCQHGQGSHVLCLLMQRSAYCLPPGPSEGSPVCEARKGKDSPCSGVVANECAAGYFCIDGVCQLPFGPLSSIGEEQVQRLQSGSSLPFPSDAEEPDRWANPPALENMDQTTASLLHLGVGVDPAFACPPGYRFKQVASGPSTPEESGMISGRCQPIADMPCNADKDCGWGLFSLSVCHLTDRRCVGVRLRFECLVMLQRLLHVLLVVRASSQHRGAEGVQGLRVASSAEPLEATHCKLETGESDSVAQDRTQNSRVRERGGGGGSP